MKKYFLIQSTSSNWVSPKVRESELDCILAIKNSFLSSYSSDCDSYDILYFDTERLYLAFLRTVTRDDVLI